MTPFRITAYAFLATFFLTTAFVPTHTKPAGVKPPITIVTDASWDVSGRQTKFGEYPLSAGKIASADTPLADVMTAKLYVVSPRQTVQECMGIMTQAKIRHLPVVSDGAVQGLVSIGDLVNATMAEQEFLISQLGSYISGDLA